MTDFYGFLRTFINPHGLSLIRLNIYLRLLWICLDIHGFSWICYLWLLLYMENYTTIWPNNTIYTLNQYDPLIQFIVLTTISVFFLFSSILFHLLNQLFLFPVLHLDFAYGFFFSFFCHVLCFNKTNVSHYLYNNLITYVYASIYEFN